MLKVNLVNSLLSLQLKFYSSSRVSRKVQDELQEKLIKVAIIGMPNAGKSTLINAIMDQRVSEIHLFFTITTNRIF